ncbi:sialidase-3-like [Amphiura filiformis]|uniref:sialidase-3-like n=1 Tax=Amphiura filiformis TaxID=82378 RepID=UPI003B219F87
MKTKLVLIILGCGLLVLVVLSVSLIYGVPSGKVSDNVWKRATPVETEAEVLFYQDMNVDNTHYNTTRIPALVYHHDMFLAFAEGRKRTQSDSGKMDIILRRGRIKDWKVEWGPMEIIASQSGYRLMDPTPIVDTEMDMILLVFNAHPSNVTAWDELADEEITTELQVIKSFDLGLTWTEPQEMNHAIQQIKPKSWLYGGAPGHGIQLKSGRLIMPGRFWSKVTDSEQMDFTNGSFPQSNVIYSDDHGNTWHPGGSLGYREDTNGIAIFSGEATAVELDNELCINARTLHPDQPRVLAFSNDEGASFGTPTLAWSLQEPGYYIRDPLKNYTYFLEDHSYWKIT